MNTSTRKNSRFAGIMLGIYADMITLPYKTALLFLLNQREELGSTFDGLVITLRETPNIDDLEEKWFQITGNKQIWNRCKSSHIGLSKSRISENTIFILSTIAALNQDLKYPDFEKCYKFRSQVENLESGRLIDVAYGPVNDWTLVPVIPIGYLDITINQKNLLVQSSINSLKKGSFKKATSAMNEADKLVKVIDFIAIENRPPGEQAYSFLYDKNQKELINALPTIALDGIDSDPKDMLNNALSVVWHSISPDNLINNVLKTGGDVSTLGMIAGCIYGSEKDFHLPEYMLRYLKDNLHPDFLKYVFN